MQPHHRNRFIAIIYCGLALVPGIFVANRLNGLLGIELRSKTLPIIPAPQVTVDENTQSIDPLSAISIPAKAMQDDLYFNAVTALREAIASRTGQQPAVIESPSHLPSGWIVVIGSSKRNSFVRLKEPDLPATDAFSFQSYRQENHQVLAITGGDRIGDIYGIYLLADKLQAGISEKELRALNEVIVPAMLDRFVDFGAVGIAPDTAAWGNDYSHHNRAFQRVFLANAPYIDQTAFDQVKNEFKTYLHRLISYGYNGVIIPGFLEYLNFDRVGSGVEIYAPDSEFRKRHLVLREKFGELFSYADDIGAKVILKTDMLALTPPLKNYFHTKLGGLEVSRDELWEVYRLGLEELFDAFPSVDGLMIRIGEGGPLYNLEGGSYSSSISVTTDEAVNTMLRAFLRVAESRDKKIFFRTWSVGVGDVGDLHTNPQTYERVLGELASDHLVISTKFTKGDFYSYMLFNPTLKIGKQKRLVEFQGRREFEAFNAFPNYAGPLHQAALLENIQHNPNVEGLWLWTQDGGPPRAGPLSLYPFHGFWLHTDANVFATGRLAWNPKADISDITEEWVRKNFSDDPQTIAKLTSVLLLSREAVEKGLYIGEFARKEITALRLEPPPTFIAWDIVDGANSTSSLVYFTCRDSLDATIADGFEAVDVVRRMKDLTRGVERETIQQSHNYKMLLASLDYEESLLATLAHYRKMVLHLYRWLDEGGASFYDEWKEAQDSFEETMREHVATYGKNLDFPAYNFFAVEAGMAHAERSLLMSWMARGLLILSLGSFLAGSGFVQKLIPGYPSKEGFRTLWLAAIAPWNLQGPSEKQAAGAFFLGLISFGLVAMGWLVFSSFLSPSFAFWLFLDFMIFTVVFILLHRRFAVHKNSQLIMIAAPLLCFNSVFMGIASVRGPLYFWYQFWTSADFRLVFVAASFVLACWIVFAIFAGAKSVYSLSSLTAASNIIIALGAVLMVSGLLAGAIGLERCLTALNNEMAVFPLGLSKALGITTQLNINPDLPLYAAACGGLCTVGGWMMRKAGVYLRAG